MASEEEEGILNWKVTIECQLRGLVRRDLIDAMCNNQGRSFCARFYFRQEDR